MIRTGSKESGPTTRVCFVSHTGNMGGAERSLLELIDALRDRGVESHVIVPILYRGALIKELRNLGITVCSLPYHWWVGRRSPLWKRLIKILLNFGGTALVVLRIKLWKCDIVYTNTITVCVGAFAAKILGLPHVWHIHEFGYEDNELVFDLGSRFSLPLMNRLSTVFVANSNAVAQKFFHYFPSSKLRVVYYSVMPRSKSYAERTFRSKSRTEARIRCVIAGMIWPGKRQEDAVLAIGELIRSGILAELTVVGGTADPKYLQYLHDTVRRTGVDKFVKFVGNVESIYPFLEETDVVLMCSVSEAFGRVTVEGMKAGKPVIGARSGGTMELIADGFNGLFYTPKDFRELSQKIKYLCENPHEARRMGKNGQKWATMRFTKDRYGDEALAIIRQVIR